MIRFKKYQQGMVAPSGHVEFEHEREWKVSDIPELCCVLICGAPHIKSRERPCSLLFCWPSFLNLEELCEENDVE